MTVFTEIFGIDDDKVSMLFKHGLIGYGVEIYYQIAKHYDDLIDSDISPTTAVLDCSIHFNVSIRHVYRARKQIAEIKKTHK